MFPNTLDDPPSKWFKLEEARGETLDWKVIRQNFISNFRFQPANENIKEVVDKIKGFITQQKYVNRTESTCLSVSQTKKDVCSPLNQLDLENDQIVGKSFRLSKTNPVTTHLVRTLLSIAKANKTQEADTNEADFPQSFTEFKEGERHLEENSPPEWLDSEIKYREVDISTDDRPKIAKIGDYWSEE